MNSTDHEQDGQVRPCSSKSNAHTGTVAEKNFACKCRTSMQPDTASLGKVWKTRRLGSKAVWR